MKKISKIFYKIILIFILVILANNSISHAGFWSDSIFKPAEDFISQGSEEDIIGQDKLVSIDTNNPGVVDIIYTVLFDIAVAATVIVGAILGVKFMLASAEDKAKIKESLVPYIIGNIVIYGAFIIWKAAVIIFSQL